VNTLRKLYRSLEASTESPHLVLDVGCLGFGQLRLTKELALDNIKHFGVDYCEPDDIPKDFTFKKADLSKQPIPYDDDRFDIVVASHIIEHIIDPISFFGECLRVCKPGGIVYLEAPSERSIWLPSMPFEHEKFYSLNYYDDPTHLARPWTPQSFYRLAKYFHCEPIVAKHKVSWKHRLLFPLLFCFAVLTKDARRMETYCWQAIGWACYIVVRKPNDLYGLPHFSYFLPSCRCK
jgi:SAM-dependent methyltransferase